MFKNCIFVKSQLINCHIEKTNFDFCNFEQVSLSQSYFTDCKFSSNRFTDIDSNNPYPIIVDSEFSKLHKSINFKASFNFYKFLELLKAEQFI